MLEPELTIKPRKIGGRLLPRRYRFLSLRIPEISARARDSVDFSEAAHRRAIVLLSDHSKRLMELCQLFRLIRRIHQTRAIRLPLPDFVHFVWLVPAISPSAPPASEPLDRLYRVAS